MLPPVGCNWSSNDCSILVLLSIGNKYTVAIIDCSLVSPYILSISGLPPLLSFVQDRIWSYVSSCGFSMLHCNGHFKDSLYIFEKLCLMPLTHWDLSAVSILAFFCLNTSFIKYDCNFSSPYFIFLTFVCSTCLCIRFENAFSLAMVCVCQFLG